MVDELSYADKIVLMKETMKDLKERFRNWKQALESKSFKVNNKKIKVMKSGPEKELFKSKIDLNHVEFVKGK